MKGEECDKGRVVCADRHANVCMQRRSRPGGGKGRFHYDGCRKDGVCGIKLKGLRTGQGQRVRDSKQKKGKREEVNVGGAAVQGGVWATIPRWGL